MSENVKYLGRQIGIVLLVLLLAAVIFAVGLMIGYGVIGSGKGSILSADTWQEILRKFTGE
ncbi:DNA-directed RNA polymerase subunit beta [Streptococcus panodentis]|uniref:DNA-directed RNA polymerase subunit beta n=1 Tax=Streptococcus panodentis TaxID=1581472 RepID=A0ABS5AV25_9STRE|nr:MULTISPECIES: DNA-directed RNA polymerase subunit beta [Streptococcus]KXT83014.1 Competence-associated EpuA protein [Streptococcus sp. DD11]MBP2620126.1 DNA-directed RNA polymerase subunit beta [Streptococcus panodentis]